MKPSVFEKRMAKAAQEVRDPRQLLLKIVVLAEGKIKPHVPVLTGTLRRSITHRVERSRGFVGTGLEYAEFVHEGTKYMAGRPFLREGVEDSLGQIEQMLKEWGIKLFNRVGSG